MSTSYDTGTYIGEADTTVPADNGTQGKRFNGAAEIRKAKAQAKASFPNVTGAVTASHTELNLLDGVTATTAELNYVDGVTSPIQTQFTNVSSALDLKAPIDDPTFTTAVSLNTTTGGYPSFRIEENGTLRGFFELGVEGAEDYVAIGIKDTDGVTSQARATFNNVNGNINLIPGTGGEVLVNSQPIIGGTSGTYTCTPTAISNVTSVTAGTGYYQRVGDIVVGSGRISAQGSTIGSIAEVQITLPVAAVISAIADVSGSGVIDTDYVPLKVDASTVTKKMRLQWKIASTSNRSTHFNFAYRLD